MAGRPSSDFPPSGCFWCDRARHDHVQRWASGVGFHKFEPPTKDLIRFRLQQRYNIAVACGIEED